MDHNLKEIFDCFRTEGTFLQGKSIGSGHIHDTFLIETAEKNKDDYIIQRLNNHIFRNIPELQDNIERVTEHLRNKISTIPGSDLKRECLTLIRTKDNKSWITDKSFNYWRMYLYIPDTHSYDIVDTPGKAFEGGKATGRFQAMLADLQGPPLHETIPFFHNVEKRLETFNAVVKKDPAGRVKSTLNEIEEVRSRAEAMKIILKLGNEGSIPLRITHNDTKFNNILLDENDKALCIIDLDTVMPGYVHYDFGDAIRTGANIATEDETDLTKVKMDISLFEAYAAGYLAETKSTLNNVEKDYLAFAPRLVTYTQAVRFLTDYIDGDNYYKIHHEHHNLERTSVQLTLLKSMEEQYGQMQEIIGKLVKDKR